MLTSLMLLAGIAATTPCDSLKSLTLPNTTIESVQLVPNGIRFAFAPKEGIVRNVAGVIERERLCCQFLRFRLEVSASVGSITLEIDGPSGTSEFLAGLHPSFRVANA